jgi:spore germination cell wall hydrolase CwlJ-like protein
MKDWVIKLLKSGGFPESLAGVIKQNGQIFGAYRSVGQGSIAERVMQAMTGGVRFGENESEAHSRKPCKRGVRS